MIPTTLDEAVDQIIAGMTQEQRDAYARQPGGHPGGAYHHGFGTAMRNDWGLWFGKTPISAYLRANRIWCGDDQSAVIFKAVWNRLNGFSTDLAAEAAHYEAFWARRGQTWDMQPIPGHVVPANWTIKLDKEGRIVEETPNGE